MPDIPQQPTLPLPLPDETLDKYAPRLVAAIQRSNTNTNYAVNALTQTTYDVRTTGAQGDGRTDDTAAVSRAISAATSAGGGIILFPYTNTSYLIDTITVSGDHLRFVGVGNPVIKQRTNTNYKVFVVTGDDVAFEGLTIDGGSSADDTSPYTYEGLIHYNGAAQGRMARCRFQHTGAYGVSLNATTQTIVDGCEFDDCYSGYLSNTQDSVTVAGLAVTNCRFTNIDDATGGAAIRMVGYASHRNVGFRVHGNYIDATCQLGIEIYVGASQGTVSGNTVRNTGWGISLASAVDVAVTGNSCAGNTEYGIEVAAASVGCAVTGNAIDGRNDAGTPVCPVGMLVSGGGGAISDNQKHVISGNTIRYGDATSYGIQCITCEYIIISGNVIDAWDEGIRVQDAADVLITGNRIDPYDSGSLLINLICASVVNSGTQIVGNRLTGTCSVGIQVNPTSTGRVNNLLVAQNQFVGLSTSGGGIQVLDNAKTLNLRCWHNYSDDLDDGTKVAGPEVLTIGGTYTVLQSDHTILCNDAGSDYTVTLPSAVNCVGRIYTFKKTTGSSHNANITPAGVETIDGTAGAYALLTAHTYVTIQSNGVEWKIIASG